MNDRRNDHSRALRGANPRPREPDPSQVDPLPKPTGYQHPPGRIDIPKELPLRSGPYKDFIRSRPCHHCATREGVQAAHFAPRGDGGGMGTKADDRRTVPQCAACHGFWHQHGVLPSTPLNSARYCDPKTGAPKIASAFTREQSEHIMLREQVRCLIAWDTLQRGE